MHTKIAVIGVGKTGKYLVDLIPSNSVIGPFHSRYLVQDHIAELNQAHVAIVFTHAAAVESFLPHLLNFQGPVIWGVTGYQFPCDIDAQLKINNQVWIHSHNFAIGMSLVYSLLELMSQYENLGASFELVETHHIQKVDAPSGTAINWQKSLLQHGVSSVPIQSIRQDDVIGEHHLTIRLPCEEIHLVHKANSRAIFAQGALWVAKKVLEKIKNVNSNDNEIISGGFYTLEKIMPQLRRPL